MCCFPSHIPVLVFSILCSSLSFLCFPPLLHRHMPAHQRPQLTSHLNNTSQKHFHLLILSLKFSFLRFSLCLLSFPTFYITHSTSHASPPGASTHLEHEVLRAHFRAEVRHAASQGDHVAFEALEPLVDVLRRDGRKLVRQGTH